MSLYHLTNKLNQLSDRRYNKGRSDIPKILNNYIRCALPIDEMSFGIKWCRGNVRTNNYIIRRVHTFSNQVPPYHVVIGMPAEHIRNQWWVDPRVEFGMQNKRERRMR